MDCSPPGFSAHGISRQEYWSELPFPSPEDLSDSGIEPTSPALAGGFFTTEPLRKPYICVYMCICVCVCVCVCVCAQLLSHVQLFVTQWYITHQAPLFMGFSRQGNWSGLPFSSPRDLPDPEIKPALLCLLHWQADSLPLSHLGSPVCVCVCVCFCIIFELWMSITNHE